MTRSLNPNIDHVASKCTRLYKEHIDPVACRLLFERQNDLEPRSGNPLVLVIGNHSSGKSTLLNHLLENNIQDTGIAPTDDGFTVIRYSEQEEIRDGAALVSHPDLGFSGLQQFGPTLVSHLKLKQTPSRILKKVTLVDTPGMIDSAHAEVGRGYDFLKVVRWFSERADVIVLLFDPDKPGTTGETLSILKSALSDLSHKVLFVLNKVDRFESVNDFAKAYGALCWNLAKAIPKKDVPGIFSMYVPGPWVSENRNALPLKSFDEAREKVFQAIDAAPQKRADNLVTNLYEQARQLHVYGTVGAVASKQFTQARFRWRVLLFAIPGIFVALTAAIYVLFGLDAWPFSVTSAAGGIIFLFVIRFLSRKALTRVKQDVEDNLSAFFESQFRRELKLGEDSDLMALWDRVRPKLKNAIQVGGLPALPRARKSELTHLMKIIESDVPELRRSLHFDAPEPETSQTPSLVVNE